MNENDFDTLIEFSMMLKLSEQRKMLSDSDRVMSILINEVIERELERRAHDKDDKEEVCHAQDDRKAKDR